MNLGILLWNKCNVSCSHCAVSSGPEETVTLSDAQIRRAIDACFYDESNPKIGLSGGEAFLYFDRLCGLVEYACSRGATVSVNTNCSWAIDDARALKRIARIRDAGLRRLIVSTDEFHLKFIPAARLLSVVRACRALHIEVELQFVATKTSLRLADFLKLHGNELLNVRCREIPCHPVGRATKEIADDDFFRTPGIPGGLCPSAVLSIAADGRVIPCCNTAGHLAELQVGTVDQAMEDLHTVFRTDAVMNLMQLHGPSIFVDAAAEAGFKTDERGYVDQCHLCHDLFSSPGTAKAIREAAACAMSEQILQEIS